RAIKTGQHPTELTANRLPCDFSKAEAKISSLANQLDELRKSLEKVSTGISQLTKHQLEASKTAQSSSTSDERVDVEALKKEMVEVKTAIQTAETKIIAAN
ncbi:jg17233, partial [Pararge aegeria aegeria]